MNENRKQIIINEIIYWKKNELLPEHYCDFLLALIYRRQRAERSIKKSRLKSKKNLIIGFILIPIVYFYFILLNYLSFCKWSLYSYLY